MSEAEILRDIFLRLGARSDIRIWRNTVGLFDQGGRKIRVGTPGQSDIFGIHRSGRFVSLEIKKPGGVVKPEQRAWIAMVTSMGGIAAVVYSADEAEKIIDSLDR